MEQSQSKVSTGVRVGLDELAASVVELEQREVGTNHPAAKSQAEEKETETET